MSDTTQNETQAAGDSAPEKQLAPKAAPKDEGGDGYGGAFKSLTAEKARLEGELAATQRKLGERDKEIGEYKSKVDGYVRRDREVAIVTKIKAARPDLEDIDIRGRLAIFAEEGKVDRFAEDSDAASKSALELINQITPPSQKRPPAQGGGPNGAPQQPRQPNALRSLFGIK